MAEKNIVMQQKKADGTFDQYYPQTKAANVKMSDGKTVEQAVQEAFQSASDGKQAIATAITGMGQTASGSDTFTNLANKIKDISKDANAAVGDVEKSKTFYQGGAKKTGTLELTGNAVVGDVLSGKTFYNDALKTKRTGTMVNRGAVVLTPSTANQAITAGYHSGGGYVKGDGNLVAGNIKSGVSIFGVGGNFEGSEPNVNMVFNLEVAAFATVNITVDGIYSFGGNVFSSATFLKFQVLVGSSWAQVPIDGSENLFVLEAGRAKIVNTSSSLKPKLIGSKLAGKVERIINTSLPAQSSLTPQHPGVYTVVGGIDEIGAAILTDYKIDDLWLNDQLKNRAAMQLCGETTAVRWRSQASQSINISVYKYSVF